MKPFFRILCLISVIVVGWIAYGANSHRVPMADGGRYGRVRLALPNDEIRGYVVFFSDRGGWTPGDERILRKIADAGAIAVGVDLDSYLRQIANATEKCNQLVGDVEKLSRSLQHDYSGRQYYFPILTGVGAGGTVADNTLPQAPVNTLSGAVAVDPDQSLPTHRPLCATTPPRSIRTGGYTYGPVETVHGFWTVAATGGLSSADRANIQALKHAGSPFDLIETKSADTATLITAAIKPHLDRLGGGGLEDLPLIELPAENPSDVLAVVLSGDGGWRDIDKTLAEELQRKGVSVVGWDSVRYFWRRKTPEETARDLTLVLDAYEAKYHANKVLLVGYSFGADVLPATYALLPERLQKQIIQMSLMALAEKGDWEITVAGWLGASWSDDAEPVAPALENVPSGLIQCIYGEQETDSACPSLTGTAVEVIPIDGGHHFNKDYVGLAKIVLDGVKRRGEQAAR